MDILKTYTHGDSILGNPIPHNVILELFMDIDSQFQDSNFYPLGALAKISLSSTPIKLFIEVEGESRLSFINGPLQGLTLTTEKEFREYFSEGDTFLAVAANSNLTKRESSKSFQLNLESLNTKNIAISLSKTSEHLTEIIRLGLQEIEMWTPHLDLFDKQIPEKQKIALVPHIKNIRILNALLDAPQIPDSVKVFVLLHKETLLRNN